MWKAIAVSAALLVAILALSTGRNAHPGLDPRDQLRFERQQAEQRQAAQAGPPADPLLTCAAARVRSATVQTLYLVWVNHRPDLAAAQERDDAAADLTRSITACGGAADAAEDHAHRRGLDLGQAAALAMLQAGR